MKPSELDAIWRALNDGERVVGWGCESYFDIHVLRRLKPDELWARRVGRSQWRLLP